MQQPCSCVLSYPVAHWRVKPLIERLLSAPQVVLKLERHSCALSYPVVHWRAKPPIERLLSAPQVAPKLERHSHGPSYPVVHWRAKPPIERLSFYLLIALMFSQCYCAQVHSNAHCRAALLVEELP